MPIFCKNSKSVKFCGVEKNVIPISSQCFLISFQLSEENSNLLIGKKVNLSEKQKNALDELITIFKNGQIDKFSEFDIKEIVPEYTKIS